MKYLFNTLFFLAISANGYAAEKDSEFLEHISKKRRLSISNLEDDSLAFFNDMFGAEYEIPEDDTPIFEKNTDITNLITDFLEPRDFIHLSQTNKANNDILSNKPHSIGNRHRELSKYSVTDINDRPFYLEEYLSKEERIPLSKINNVALIAKEKPKDFIKIVLKSIPHTPETIENNLQSYYQDVVQIEELVNSLPKYETAQEKLVAFLVDVEVRAQFVAQFVAQVWAQIRDQVGAPVRDQVEAQVWAQVRTQVRNQVRTQVRVQVWDQVGDQVGAQVGAQVWAQILADLSNFNFSSALREHQLSEVLNPAIDYSFIVKQLASISLLHSQEIRQMIESLKNNFTEEQAGNILAHFNLPEAPEGNYLVKTQLDILRRHLPTQN